MLYTHNALLKGNLLNGGLPFFITKTKGTTMEEPEVIITCPCSPDQELDFSDLKIRDDSFDHAFGTHHDYSVVCVHCGGDMNEYATPRELMRWS